MLCFTQHDFDVPHGRLDLGRGGQVIDFERDGLSGSGSERQVDAMDAFIARKSIRRRNRNNYDGKQQREDICSFVLSD